MQNTYSTERLSIGPLTTADISFIRELVNTEGWVAFIGNRNVNSDEDALGYIQKILNNPDVRYWMVYLKETSVPVGIITFIKRDYLQHHDIGFAFLPAYAGKGYAYEAAKKILEDLLSHPVYIQIQATTVPENASSIKLLEKLGLKFEKEIVVENETLKLYGIAKDKK
ncbi:MAG: Acetyltransferase, including N-acetylase of ribosomal protein [Bacteroidetes bacterium]|jgi:RimJ/RimL family protein N-acetyltransferase|nr:Acetyltransferase, including N-acetylase of ribosomal protein [Bacteroidota bacterium]